MPQLGEIKKAKDIGIKYRTLHIWHKCPECGEERWVRCINGKPLCNVCRRCSGKVSRRKIMERTGNSNPHWKGGRIRRSNGYIQIRLTPDNFFYSMCKADGYVMEHRLVMAHHLGRCLHSWEIVHHKNHIRDDNRLENLQLVSDDRHIQITILENEILKLRAKLKELGKENKLLRDEKLQLQSRLLTMSKGQVSSPALFR